MYARKASIRTRASRRSRSATATCRDVPRARPAASNKPPPRWNTIQQHRGAQLQHRPERRGAVAPERRYGRAQPCCRAGGGRHHEQHHRVVAPNQRNHPAERGHGRGPVSVTADALRVQSKIVGNSMRLFRLQASDTSLTQKHLDAPGLPGALLTIWRLASPTLFRGLALRHGRQLDFLTLVKPGTHAETYKEYVRSMNFDHEFLGSPLLVGFAFSTAQATHQEPGSHRRIHATGSSADDLTPETPEPSHFD